MKLGSLRKGGRDGTLVVVDRNLKRAVEATGIAPTMQAAIEDWTRVEPLLNRLYEALNRGSAPGAFDLDVKQLASPFPRAYQFLDGSVYLSHMKKARAQRNAAMPPNYEIDPLMYQGLSDRFIGPVDDMPLPTEADGIDIEAEVAVVLDDVPIGVSVEQAKRHIKLVMLLNDFTLREITKNELPKGFGFLQSKPTSGFSPVAVTLDELEGLWDGNTLQARLITSINGRKIGEPHAGQDMYFSYPQLIAHAARTRALSAGTILGAGTVANADESSGAACLAELRSNEELEHGKALTPFLKFGDVVGIEVRDESGQSIFGAIQHRVVQAKAV